MKHLICILFAAMISVSAFAQETALENILKSKDGKYVFEEVVSVPEATASQLYGKAKLFFANTFNSSKSVIQSDDSENNTIVGKGTIVKHEDEGFGGIYYYFTLQIQSKEGKYRYTISDIKLDMTGLAPMKSSIEESVERGMQKGLSETDAAKSYYEEFSPIIEKIKQQIMISNDDNW